MKRKESTHHPITVTITIIVTITITIIVRALTVRCTATRQVA